LLVHSFPRASVAKRKTAKKRKRQRQKKERGSDKRQKELAKKNRPLNVVRPRRERGQAPSKVRFGSKKRKMETRKKGCKVCDRRTGWGRAKHGKNNLPVDQVQ